MANIKLVTVLALVVLLVAAKPAAAQGTFGALPDPISSRDLERYGERLGLSDQQLLAIAEHHGRYLEAFRELRDRDMQQLLDNVQNLMRDFDFSQRREVERQMRALERIMQRIRSLDERLFDEMLDVLTEEQAARLPRVRLERERARYTSEMTRGIDYLNPAVRVDLSTIVHSMNLSPQAMELVDPVLETYERRLTVASRRLFETTTNMILDTLKRLEEMGFTEGSPQDPRMALRLFEAFQEIWSEISAEVLKEASDVASMQRSTYRSLAALLPEDAQRELRRQYYRRAYPEAAAIGRASQRQFDAALQLEELNERQRADIAVMANSHWNNQDRIANQVVDLLDARRRDFSIREIVRRNEDERARQIDDLRARADAADEVAMSSLYEVLGDELAERVRTARASGTPARPRRTQAAAPVQGDDVDAGDPFIGRLPARISSADANAYAARLGLDEGQRVIIESLHEDYLDRYRELSEQRLAPLRAAAREMAAMGAGIGAASSLEVQRAEEIFAMQREAFDALRELDETFFRDVGSIIEPGQAAVLERLRLQRERLAYTGGANRPRHADWGEASRFMRGQMTNESSIDLSRLIDQLQMRSSLGGSSDEALLAYERKATELFRDKYEVELRMYHALRTINPQEDRRRFREVMASAGRASVEVSRALATLNRESLANLRAALPPEAAYHLQYHYRRHAFPAGFDDPGRAEEAIAAALNLAELADSQRTRLRELSLEYRAAYARVEERMFETLEAMAQLEDIEARRERGEAMMQTRNRLDRLRFERDEINENARRQLRSILSDEQRQRVGVH